MSTRHSTYALAGLLVAAVTTGCGGAVTTAANDKADGVYTQLAGLPKDQQRARAEELAKQEGGTLSLYTSMTADIATPIAQAFEKKYGIRVSVFRGNSETVLQRTLQEAQAGKAGADVVETNFLEMSALSDNGVLAQFNGSALDKVDPTGKFEHWTASRLNVFQPAWNTDLIKPADEPHSWEDLALPKYKGKLTLEVSDSDWFENVTKYWLDHGKSQAEVDKLWKDIVGNAKVAKGHTTMMQFLTAGQTPMEAMNYTYITVRAAQQGAPVTHLPSSGVSKIPAFARPNGVAMVKGAQHPATAWLFYDWLLTDGQKELVELGLTPSTKVPGDKSLDGLTLAPFDVEGLSKDHGEWDKKYDALLRGAATVGE
ncbi:iron(III) ABC transporter iron (III)-binding protein [Streptomyces spinoverrucosus]|uniref:Iron(III) ABC transporter iron (III)-binding protein n=1 Tax=Streptomyces spinoverrucosus TaxID=284043 RepID=A0A4Y3VA53_9ACTN|nr:extracellular solute-binding protein [Streptomyces spinoverrucosus]GEC03225.1 iron(III) ABC transporter iron (III)-binding protein [Streptomyces spinoverrucosus]GHB37288.1 iron(III) ABC transporter iron (III)-binding protein [Streptomyces spinoverrucosus]